MQNKWFFKDAPVDFRIFVMITNVEYVSITILHLKSFSLKSPFQTIVCIFRYIVLGLIRLVFGTLTSREEYRYVRNFVYFLYG